MAKRAKTRSFRAKRLKACQGSELSKDRISEVPDAIIVYILSLLTMKEAGRTSVLSKRWIYVWSYIPVLNFEASDTIEDLLLDKKLFHEEKPRYLYWVNQVVRSYRGPTIDEFRVRFDLIVTSRHSIDYWVKFAMEKRVKRLELNFHPEIRDVGPRCYTFHRRLPVSNLLTCLKLVFVNVTGEVLQNFLKNCPNLECLSIEYSISLVRLSGEALNLRYLELLRCHYVQHIELSAPNLVSFNYIGPRIDMPFTIIPKLSKLSMGGDYAKYLISNSLEFSSYLFQLEALWMELYDIKDDVMKYVDQFPVCTKLEQLELTTNPLYDGDLFCFGKILKACPLLQKFVLTVKWFSTPVESEWLEVESCSDRHLNKLEVESYPHYHLEMFGFAVCLHHRMKRLEVETSPHYHLKIVKIVGFVGDPIELEFIVYLTEICIALEKIIIDPRQPSRIGTPWEFQENETKTRARKKAEQLHTKLKPKVDLIIL